MNPPHEPLEQLRGYVEGLLPDEHDARIERHLRLCQECAAFADSYARFLATIEDPPEPDPALDAASSRLDARMAPYLRPIPVRSAQSVQVLSHAFSLAEVVHLAGQRLLELARTHRDWGLSIGRPEPEPVLAWAEGATGLPEVSSQAVVIQSDGSRASTTVRLGVPPAWPSDSVDLLLEFDLDYRGWNATVGYLIDPPETPGGATALLLQDGPVDPEGLVEIRRRWDGPAPQSFEPSRLCICVVSPVSLDSAFNSETT